MRRTKEALEFLKDLIDVCEKHGLTLGHEDSQGAFIVRPYDSENIIWLSNAADET